MTAPEPASLRPDPITEAANKLTSLWFVAFVMHYIVGVGGGMILGFAPEALLSRLYYNTGLEPFAPGIALTAFLLGYFLSQRLFLGRPARWIWIIGALWLAFGIYDETRSWSASWSVEKTRWQYALAQFFGSTSRCSDSECLCEVFYTMPFVASIMYSVGAYLRARRLKKVN